MNSMKAPNSEALLFQQKLIGTKWEQEWDQSGNKNPKVRQEWEQSANKNPKRDKNGNKVEGTIIKIGNQVPTRTKDKNGNKVGTRIQEWDKNGNKVGTRTQKWDKNSNKVGTRIQKWDKNPKVGQEWEQSGNKNPKGGTRLGTRMGTK